MFYKHAQLKKKKVWGNHDPLTRVSAKCPQGKLRPVRVRDWARVTVTVGEGNFPRRQLS